MCMSRLSYVYQNRRWIGAGRADCVAKRGMVSSKHPMIGETGVEIIRNGGNAVDAAVGAAFMNCVVEPAMNGIGGEGVMAIHLESGENVIIDYVGRIKRQLVERKLKAAETKPSQQIQRGTHGQR